jgi:4-oxalocrotonate tautomerase
MPLVRIDLVVGKSAAYRSAISDVVYDAMTSVLKAPEHDRFMVISEHSRDNLVVDPDYLGIHRTADAVLIEVILNEGRSVATKQGFYRAVADGLHERIGLRREDVVIGLVEVKKENWSFGNGEAQYVS